jgi:hypothetical protein
MRVFGLIGCWGAHQSGGSRHNHFGSVGSFIADWAARFMTTTSVGVPTSLLNYGYSFLLAFFAPLREIRFVRLPVSNPAFPVLQEAERESDTGCGIVVTVADDKALQKMRKSPMGWRIEELQAVAEETSVEWRRPGRGGSHVIFSAPGVREIVSVPAKRPIKPVYIKRFVALIDASRGIRTK